jgi:hypothetical protein
MGEYPYSCDTYVKALSSNQNLKTHQPVHIGEHPYTCDVFLEAFTAWSELRHNLHLYTGNIHII